MIKSPCFSKMRLINDLDTSNKVLDTLLYKVYMGEKNVPPIFLGLDVRTSDRTSQLFVQFSLD